MATTFPAPDSAPTPPSPPSASEWFGLLDFNGNDHLARDDVVSVFAYVSLYPKTDELLELVSFIGDGERVEFVRSWNDQDKSKPSLLNGQTLDDMRKNRDGALFANSSNTFWSNFALLFAAYFAWPFNIFFGKKWALRVMSEDYYDVWWYKFLPMACIFDFCVLAMIALGVWSDSSKTWTTVLLFIFLTVVLTSTQIAFEATSGLPEINNRSSQLVLMFHRQPSCARLGRQ